MATQLSIFDFDVFKEEKKEISLENNNIFSNEDIGKVVIISYCNKQYIGKIVHVYNAGETVNVLFDGMQTAFYYKKVNIID